MTDIIIIGGGPAALTAALYSLRAGRSVLLLEKENFGGQIADSPKVENFPAQKSISGIELIDLMFEQVEALGVQYELDEALSISKVGNTFKIKGKYDEYEAKAVIIANGVKHRHLNIEGEEKYIGNGISFCAVCDGAFYKDRPVTVIGDANSALQYSISLAKTSSHVNVVTLFDRFFADPILVEALKEFPNVSIYHNKNAFSFYGDGEKLQGVKFKDTKTGEILDIENPGVFVAIGQIPDNDRFSDVCDLENGFFLSDENMTTKTPGLFVAGDCRKKKIRQLTTACSDGAIAALSANSYLFTLKD